MYKHKKGINWPVNTSGQYALQCWKFRNYFKRKSTKIITPIPGLWHPTTWPCYHHLLKVMKFWWSQVAFSWGWNHNFEGLFFFALAEALWFLWDSDCWSSTIQQFEFYYNNNHLNYQQLLVTLTAHWWQVFLGCFTTLKISVEESEYFSFEFQASLRQLLRIFGTEEQQQ